MGIITTHIKSHVKYLAFRLGKLILLIHQFRIQICNKNAFCFMHLFCKSAFCLSIKCPTNLQYQNLYISEIQKLILYQFYIFSFQMHKESIEKTAAVFCMFLCCLMQKISILCICLYQPSIIKRVKYAHFAAATHLSMSCKPWVWLELERHCMDKWVHCTFYIIAQRVAIATSPKAADKMQRE